MNEELNKENKVKSHNFELHLQQLADKAEINKIPNGHTKPVKYGSKTLYSLSKNPKEISKAKNFRKQKFCLTLNLKSNKLKCYKKYLIRV